MLGFSCCCCPALVGDPYSSDTSADYTNSVGSASISGGGRTTSSASFLSTHNNTSSTGHGRVKVRGKVSVSNRTWRIIGGYTDDDNLIKGDILINGGSSTAKIFDRTAGIDTQVGSTFTFTGAVDTFKEAQLCWNGTAAMLGLDGAACVGGLCSRTGNKAGYGATLASGTATFDDFTFHKNRIDSESCPACGDCTFCDDGTCPPRMQVIIDGITNVACADCASMMNGTFVLDYAPTTLLNCRWTLPVGGFMCNVGFGSLLYNQVLNLRIVASGADRILTVFWENTNLGSIDTNIVFSTTLAGPTIPCDLDSVSLPFVPDSENGCDGAGATCLVTAL